MKRLILILLFFYSYSGFSQKIYILGKLKSNDDMKIIGLVNALNNQFKIKTLALYYNSMNELFVYKRKKSSNGFELNDILIKKINDSEKITSPNNQTIDNYRNIIKNAGKRPIVIYGDNELDKFSELVENELFKLKSNKVKVKNTAFIIVFRTFKPVITIESPNTDDVFDTSRIKITGTTSAPKGTVSIFVNGGKGVSARIKNPNGNNSDWEAWVTLNNSIDGNSIEVIATYNDENTITTLDNIIYKKKEVIVPSLPPAKPVLLAIRYQSPRIDGELVDKCMFAAAYNFKFTFSIDDPKIKMDSVILVIENSKNESVIEESVASLTAQNRSWSSHIVSNTRTDYCIYAYYKDIGFSDPCQIDVEDNYFYYLKYNNKYFPTEKILIHFSSFDKHDNGEPQCDCN